MTITIDDLTKNELEGTGVFDELMRTVKAHLEAELTKGSITDVNYSSVYLGALQSTMDQSVRFLLERDKIGIQNDIALVQKANIEKEGVLLDIQTQIKEYELYNAKYQECLLHEQLAKVASENASVQQSTANAKTQANLITKQIAKTDMEIKLYAQKTRTEEAQIRDKVDDVSVAGVIGRQKEMFRNQSNGYLRLAEQQNARLMLDAFAVLQTNAGLAEFEGTTAASWGVDPASVTAAVDKLAAGVAPTEHEVKPTVETDPAGQPTAVTYTELDTEDAVVPTPCVVTIPSSVVGIG